MKDSFEQELEAELFFIPVAHHTWLFILRWYLSSTVFRTFPAAWLPLLWHQSPQFSLPGAAFPQEGWHSLCCVEPGFYITQVQPRAGGGICSHSLVLYNYEKGHLSWHCLSLPLFQTSHISQFIHCLHFFFLSPQAIAHLMLFLTWKVLPLFFF